MVWEGEAIVLPCGNQSSSRLRSVKWLKGPNSNNIFVPVISCAKTDGPVVYLPWTKAVVQVVEGRSLSILSTSYPRDHGVFRCIVDSLDKRVHLAVLGKAISHRSIPPAAGQVIRLCVHFCVFSHIFTALLLQCGLFMLNSSYPEFI